MVPPTVSARPRLGPSFGRMCRGTRLSLDVSQQQLADRVGVTRSYVGRIERGAANPSVRLVEAIADALGIELDLVARLPTVHKPRQPHDTIHARCSAYVDRRLRALGLETAREVEVVHGRSHGWIDLLAFEPASATILVVEIKTRLDDLGAIERQLAWYERSAWAIARHLGWSPRQSQSWLLVLASEEIDVVLRTHRDLFQRAFPRRADSMTGDLSGLRAGDQRGRGIAMIDPASRRQRWLIPTRMDGRRSAAKYRGYADAASG